MPLIVLKYWLHCILSQRTFNAEFYEEDENEKPVFEDDLDDIGEFDLYQVKIYSSLPDLVSFIFIVS